MKKLLTLSVAVLLLISAQAQQTTTSDFVQTMVSSITDNIELLSSQVLQIENAAARYIERIQEANGQYSSDDTSLIHAKAAAWQDYNMQVRNILTDEQYSVLQQKQKNNRQNYIDNLKK